MTYSSSPTNPARSARAVKPRSFKNNMQSLISRGKAFLTPNQSSTNLNKQGFQTAKSPTQLFPTVDPAVDGEECLHDCDSCTISLPRKWEIDEEDTLYSHVKGWDTHVVVATGKTDWVRDIADEKGSLMETMDKYGLKIQNGKVMLSASDMPTGNEHDEDHLGPDAYARNGKTRCLVLPKWTMVEGVGSNEVDWLMNEVVGKGATNLSPLEFRTSELEKIIPPQLHSTNGNSEPNQDESPTLSNLTISQPEVEPELTLTTNTNPKPLPSLTPPSNITLRPCGHRAIILMCSHKTRDWRCGASAPLLRRELERHLRPLGLYRDIHDERPGGVGIYFINHVGGHKYSANVMVYRREISKRTIPKVESTSQLSSGTENGDKTEAEEEMGDPLSDEAVQGIWLARVRPEDCENIVRYTVLQGKVVKPMSQLRGGFNRESGFISW